MSAQIPMDFARHFEAERLRLVNRQLAREHGDHQRALALSRYVRRALRSAEALAWRKSFDPSYERWDDGPCVHVAQAIAVADAHLGRVVGVDWDPNCDGTYYHVVYHVGSSWCVDGHGARRRRFRPIVYAELPEAPESLVRAIRLAMEAPS